MKPSPWRALHCALLAGATFVALAATPASAQSGHQKEYYIGEGEVDIYGGTFKYSNTDLSIGPAQGGMSLVRYAQVRGAYGGSFGLDTTHNLEAAIYRQPYREDAAGASQSSYYFHVLVGRHVNTFDWNRYSYTNQSPLKFPDGSSLAYSSTSGPFVYTAKDGTVINFGTISGSCRNIGYTSNCSPANSMVTPDGTTTTFSYDLSGQFRLRLATNNRGFGIGFVYNGNQEIITACAINLALAHVTAASPCPTSAPATGYAYSYGDLVTFTDTAGHPTTYGYVSSAMLSSIKNPGSSSNDLVVGYHPVSRRVSSQTYGNGATWSYSYQMTESAETAGGSWNEWTEVTSPLGHKTLHNFLGGPAPKPKSITDPLGRMVVFTFLGDGPTHGLIEKRIEPEGNYTHYSYDPLQNVTQTRLVAKPGSGLADIVSSSAVYPSSCAAPKTCGKPTSTTDARGGVTDYVYDATHGGTLSVTGPAVNGVRPQVRYTYAQKYAGVNSGGALVQAATPVWVVVEEAQCMTAASCTGGADEVKTAYDWGTYQSGPLMLRGKVVDPGGLNLRTCYGYDARGNRISETEPKAGLQSCP